jgi:hypothetical protein
MVERHASDVHRKPAVLEVQEDVVHPVDLVHYVVPAVLSY